MPFAFDAEAAVGRADDAHVVAERGEFAGQRPDHVGETADFHKRFKLGSDKENLQRAHARVLPARS